MAKTKTTLKLALEVAAQTEEYSDFTPANLADVWVETFVTEGAFDPNATVKLMWDYGGAGEEVLWCSEGVSKMPFEANVTGDGTKKLALVCDNANTGPVFLAGYVELWELT